MPSLHVVEQVVDHAFETTGTTIAAPDVGDEDDDDKTAERSDDDSEVELMLLSGQGKPVVKGFSDVGSMDAPPHSSTDGMNEIVCADATEQALPSSSEKRRVTPTADTRETKKKQQKKVNQMNLNVFFHRVPPGQKPPAAPTLPSFTNQRSNAASEKAARKPKVSLPASDSKKQTKKRSKIPRKAQTVMESADENMDVDESSDKTAKQSSNAASASRKPASVPSPDSLAPAKKKRRKRSTATPTKPQNAKATVHEGMDTESSEEASSSASASIPAANTPVGEGEGGVKPMMTATTDSLQDRPATCDDKETVETREAADTVVVTDENKVQKAEAVLESASEHAKDEHAKESFTTDNTEKDVVEIQKSSSDEGPCSDEPLVELSEEREELLQKYSEMKKRCQQRFEELFQTAREGIDEEDFEMPPLESKTDLSSEDEFPDVVVNNMAILIEGSSMPLSKLTSTVCDKLRECHQKEWAEDAVSTKIKLIAERKPYLESASTFKNDVVGRYEDESIDRMWRWEFRILEVLPSAILPKIRKARTARRKFLNHYIANQKLLMSLEDADSIVRDMTTTKLDLITGKISKDEEKVLKFDREAEKQRLLQVATRKKDQEQEAKRKEKEREKERKKEEAEKKRLEKEREKQEAAEARDAEKRKRDEVKERQQLEKKKKEQLKNEILSRQKSCLMSFFAKSAPKEAKDAAEPEQVGPLGVSKDAKTGDSMSTAFNPDYFRSLVDRQEPSERSRPLFPSLSYSAIQSRQRRTRKVAVSVFVTVMPESNGFDEQPFAEQQIIRISNKYRFLSFHEDYRPPYHGTWSKRSKLITGRTPFNKDTTYLDYDYDSEAEWEEGDDEIGEDVDDDAKNQEEEEEEEGLAAKMYDYDDGFCVADEQYLDIDEDVDEETKALYRRKLQRIEEAASTGNRICILGPAMGGKPPSDSLVPELIEGFEKGEAIDLLAAHTGKQLCQDLLWLDAFAPDKIDELDPSPDAEKPDLTTSSNKDEHTLEEMKALATFAHHCTLNSKEKLIEELRNANPDAFGSRAKATRKLDSIAEKKKHPSGTGFYWEVNKDVLEELMLDDVLAKKLPTSDSAPTNAKGSTDSSKKTKTEASAANVKAAKPSKKRKSSEESATSEETAVTTKKVKVAKGSAASKGKSSSKLSPVIAASASAMMNFLQPRKKPKGIVASSKEEGRQDETELLSPVVIN